MFKNWLKQVAVVLISLIIVVSPLVPSFTVRADDYKKSDTDNDSEVPIISLTDNR